jgi:hypothetical protein
MFECPVAARASTAHLTSPLCLQYEQKLFKLLDDYDKLFMLNADNVGSKHI